MDTFSVVITWEEDAIGIEWVEARDVANVLKSTGQAPPQRIMQPRRWGHLLRFWELHCPTLATRRGLSPSGTVSRSRGPYLFIAEVSRGKLTLPPDFP